MDIQILKEFVDLSETLNYSKTAENMFIGRSTLSKHIIMLEEELDVQLFVRNKQAVRLTNIGRLFQKKAKDMIAIYEESMMMIQKEKGGTTGELSIGFLNGATRDILIKCINVYRTNYPQMKMSLMSGELGDLIEAFKNNKIDIALTLLFEDSVLPDDVNFELLYEEEIAAVLPKDCPLIQKDTIRFEDLLDYPMILPSPTQFPTYAEMVRGHIESAQKEANIICDYTHVATAMIMTEANMGVCILPTDIAPQISTAVFRTIEDFNPILMVGIMWKKNNFSIGLVEFVETMLTVSGNEFETNTGD